MISKLATGIGALFVALAASLTNAATPAKDVGINLIPWPQVIDLADGSLPLTADSKVVATDPALAPLAKILADELSTLTSLPIKPAAGEGAPGDIVLKLDPALRTDADIYALKDQQFQWVRDFAHTLVVTDRVTITGFDYRAACEGTATLLQSLQHTDNNFSIPKLTIKDWPAADYMGSMIDTARQDIPVESLKRAVEAARLYKVRYIHLHMSDDQAWTFPSTAFPLLGTKNIAAHKGIVPRVYKIEELNDLVAFADARGVTLIPGIETPAHSGAARLAMPDPLDSINPDTGKLRGLALMNMVNPKMYELLDTVIGEACDVFKSSPYVHIGCDETNWDAIDKAPEVVAYMKEHNLDHIGLFKEHVLKMNDIVKKHGRRTIIWQGDASFASKDVIVMTWRQGDIHHAEKLIAQGYTTITVPWVLGVPLPDWNMYLCNGSVLKPGDRVLGAMVPMWEMSGPALLSHQYVRHRFPERQERTWNPATTFTMDDLTQRMASTDDLLGRLALPITISAEGLDIPNEFVFYSKILARVKSRLPGEFHYTIDDSEPTAQSPKYSQPVELTKTTTFKVALFDPQGNQIDSPAQELWRRVPYEKNLATSRPVTASAGTQNGHDPENAVDGRTDTAWWAGPSPQWLQVDLGQPCNIDRIDIFTFVDKRRYYQYTVEASLDDKTWTKVVDMSANTKTATEAGEAHDIPPTSMRYVRVSMLKNSVNTGIHLGEVRVYEVGKHPADLPPIDK